MLEEVPGGALCTCRLVLDRGEVWAWRSSGCDDHDGLIVVHIVHECLHEALDVECRDISDGGEVFIQDRDAFCVDLPAHGEHGLYSQIEERQAGCANPIEEAEVHH